MPWVFAMHVYFSNSLLQSKKEKKRTFGSRRFTEFFFLIYPDGSAFVTILPLISVSVRYICIAFFHSRILFFSGYTHSIHTSTKIPDKTHTTHTKRTLTQTKNKKRSRRLSCLSDAGPTPTCLWRTVNPPTPAPECSGSRWGGKPVWGFVVRR